MNQILDDEKNTVFSDKRSVNDFSPGQLPNYSRTSANRTLKNLSIVLLIFAILIAFVVLYIKNAKKREMKENILNEQKSRKEDSIDYQILKEKMNILVRAKKPIKQIIYGWNGDIATEVALKVNNSLTFKVNDIVLPIGKNLFKVKLIHQDDSAESFDKEVNSEFGKDIQKPKIDLSLNGTEIVINVKDNVEIAEVYYNWDGDQKKYNISVTNETKKELKAQLNPKVGNATLRVVAVDKAGNMETVEKAFNGVEAPIVSIRQTADYKYLEIKVTHPIGISKIEYTLNGKKYLKKYNEDATDNKDITIMQELDMGNNVIIIKTTSVQGIESETWQGSAKR